MSYIYKGLNEKVFPQHTLFLAELAKKEGYEVEWIDRWTGYLLKIDDQLFGYGHFPKFPLNSAAARALCKDKVFSYQLLEKNGLVVPEGDYFIKYDERYIDNSRGKGKNEAIEYAKKLGFSVFVKPNRMAMGIHCQVVNTAEELEKVIDEVFLDDHIVVVQKIVKKPEYRLVVLDGEIILGYRKLMPTVTGDGLATVDVLVKRLKKDVPKLVIDWDWLKKNGWKKSDIVPAGEEILLRDNANLSTGGVISKVLEKIPDDLKKYVAKITKLFKVRLAGIDLMADDLADSRTFTVIEINADPGFEAYMQYDEKRVKEIYKKIFIKCLE